MNKEEIDKWLDNEYGMSYTRLEELHDFYFEKYCDLQQENKQLKRQLEYLRSGEYINQLRFERDMLQDLVNNGEISKEDKEFIDCTHRNTELLEKIDKAVELLEYVNRTKGKIGYNENEKDYLDSLEEILKGE